VSGARRAGRRHVALLLLVATWVVAALRGLDLPVPSGGGDW